MTPTEEWKEQTPVRREASLAEKVAWAGLGLLLAGGIAFLGLQMGFFGRDADDDDDRPPIIVRNGSVHVEASFTGADGKRGQLEKAAGKVWHHAHDGNKPKNLSVFVSDLDPNSSAGCGASPYFFAQKAKTVTVTYAYVSGEQTLERTLIFEVGEKGGEKALQLTADANAEYTPTGDYALDFDTAGRAQLKSVTIAHKDKGNADKTVTCEFAAGSGQVAILQRK